MPSVSLAKLRAHVSLVYRASSKTRSTAQKAEQLLGELIAVLGPDATTDRLTTSGIAAWMGLYAPRRAPHTVIGHLGVLRTLCAMAVEEGWLERAPVWKRLRPRARPLVEQRHYSLAEISTLLRYLAGRAPGSWAAHRLYAAVAIAAYTGLRRDELLCLEWGHVDLVAGIISVVPLPGRVLKTARSCRAVPIPPGLRPILEAWRPFATPIHVLPGAKRKGPWRRAKAGRRPVDELKAACAASGIPAGTWQWLRRSWATHAESAWLFSEPAIERVLGHTSPVSKTWYRRADLENLRAIGQRVVFPP
jgi:integrase